MASGSKALLSLAAAAARWLPAPVKRGLYRLRPLAGLIRRGLNRAAPSGLNEVKIAGGALAGLRFRLDLQSEKDYWLGTYETELQQAAATLVRPGETVYDVGANAGYISLLLAKFAGPQGQVFAFEALPENVIRLRGNMQLNPGLAPVSVQHQAVVEASRPVRFLVGPSDDMGKAEGSAGRQGIVYGEAIEVPGVSLDDFVFAGEHPAPRVVKMDIEGGEVLALPGMRRVLQECRPRLLIELHGEQAARQAWDVLAAAGYRICRMARGFPEVRAVEELDWKAYLVAFPPGSGEDNFKTA